MKRCTLKLNVKTCAQLRNIYVHIYGNFPHYTQSSNTCTKTAVMNPQEKKGSSGPAAPARACAPRRRLHRVSQVTGARGELRFLRVIPDSNYIYTLIVHL